MPTDSLASIRSVAISAFKEFDPALEDVWSTRDELDRAEVHLTRAKDRLANAGEAVREAKARGERDLDESASVVWEVLKNAEGRLVAREAELVKAQEKHGGKLAKGAEQRAAIYKAVETLEAVPPAEWQQVCRTSVSDGVYALTLQSRIDPRLKGPRFPPDCLALAVAVHAGVTMPVARELMKRVEHVGPERILEGVSLDDVIAAQSDFVRLQAKVKITEGVRPGSHGRKSISEKVRREVWRRDHGRCVDCGSRERLEFDHIIPVSAGGSNTSRNLELRCEVCNRAKSNKI